VAYDKLGEATMTQHADLIARLREQKAVHSSYSGTGRVVLVRGDATDPLCREAAAVIEALVAERDECNERRSETIAMCEQLRAERDAAVGALRKIKEHVVGDKFPNWSTHDAVYASRAYIADWCDHYAARQPNAQGKT
jgi:hypothetical protein